MSSPFPLLPWSLCFSVLSFSQNCVGMIRLIDTLTTSDTTNTDHTVSSSCPPFLPSFLPRHLDLCLSYSSCIFGTEQQSNTGKDMLQITPVPKGVYVIIVSSFPPHIHRLARAPTLSYTQGNADQSRCPSRQMAPRLLLSRQARWLRGHGAHANEIVSILGWVTENRSAISFHTHGPGMALLDAT